MATTEKPKSRLPDGRVNPDYTAWRKAKKLATGNQELDEEKSDRDTQDAQEVAATAAEVAESFQSAAEPEQTNSDDPREPEVAPALENPLADGDTIEITVDRLARNKSFVYGDLNGELVPIRVKKKLGPRLLGKPIPVLVTVEAGHTLYTHAT